MYLKEHRHGNLKLSLYTLTTRTGMWLCLLVMFPLRTAASPETPFKLGTTQSWREEPASQWNGSYHTLNKYDNEADAGAIARGVICIMWGASRRWVWAERGWEWEVFCPRVGCKVRRMGKRRNKWETFEMVESWLASEGHCSPKLQCLCIITPNLKNTLCW